MGNFLTRKQRKELLGELKLEHIRRYADRLRVILLLDQGWTYKKIAEALFLDEGTVGNYKKRYKLGEIEGLINDDYLGKKTMLTEQDLRILSNDLQERVFPTTKSVIAHVKKKFGVKYTRGGMTDLLHRLGFSFKKPKGVPGKADSAKQEEFVRKYKRAKSQGGLIYFGDATHPTFNTTLNYGWIKKGEDFEVKTNSGRHRININGAIEINTMDVVTRSYPTINQYSICDFIKAIRAKNPNEKRITLILDNANYYRAKRVRALAKKLRIRLLYLPPYSPNLNPIERLWEFMKKKALPNEYVENFEDWKYEMMSFFRGIRKYRSELETLITDNFQIVGT